RKFRSLFKSQGVFDDKEFEDALSKARLLSELPF
ncbi:MAG: cysteine synthase family protein, partial [Candidatus Nitrosothermus koennekii]